MSEQQDETGKQGKHIGYKVCRNRLLVTLEILGNANDNDNNEGRTGVVDKMRAKFRCKSVKVLEIIKFETGAVRTTAESLWTNNFIYTVGETITVAKYDKTPENLCGQGIHYFLSKEPAIAFYYNMNFCDVTRSDDRFNGMRRTWYDNGQVCTEGARKDGAKDGVWRSWYENGQLYTVETWDAGKRVGTGSFYCTKGALHREFTWENNQVVHDSHHNLHCDHNS